MIPKEKTLGVGKIQAPPTKLGIAYPSWYVTPAPVKGDQGGEGGTIQGRITCKNPAAQTFPPIIKDCMVSRWPNGVIVSYDLSQIELRIAALISGCDTLLSAYCGPNPLDLHTERAKRIFGASCIASPNFYESHRQPAKHVNFSDLFRAGANKIQATILVKAGQIIDLEFCEQIVSDRPHTRPGLWAWQGRTIQQAHSKGYLELPFIGQSRHFLGGDKYDISEIINFPIQTTAGNLLLHIQHYIHKHGPSLADPKPPFLMFLNVYDAIYFDVRVQSYLPQLRSLFQEAVNHVVTQGYYARLQQYYQREVPVLYEESAHHSLSNP